VRDWKTWAGLAAISLAAVFALPEGVEYVADRVARERLREVGADVEWGGVEWFWTRTLQFTQLRASRGSRASAEFDSLEVAVALGPLVAGRLRPVGLWASGLEATVAGPDDSSSAPVGGGERPGGERSLPDLLENLRTVELRDADLLVRRGGRDLVELGGDARLGTDGTLEGDGRLRLLRDSGEAAVDWRLTGRGDLAAGSLRGELELGPPEAGAARAGERGGLEVRRLRGSAEAVEFRLGAAAPEARAALEFRDFSASVGAAEPHGLEISGPSIGVRALRDGRVRISGDSARIAAAPDRLLRTLRGASGDSPAGRLGDDSTKAPSRSLRSLVAERVDLHLAGASLEVSVGGEEGRRTYRPGGTLTIRKRRRRISVAGPFAGGRATASARFEAGRTLPTRGSFAIRGVRLDRIPVVRPERSVPDRGLRGEVGGTLDAIGSLIRTGFPGTLRERVAGSVEVAWRDGSVRADGLAEETVRNIDLSGGLSAVWEPQLGRLRLRESALHFGPIDVALEGSLVDPGLDPHLSLEASVSEIACERAVRSLPDTLLGPYRDVAIEGRAAPRFSLELPLETPGDVSIDLDGFPGPCRPTALNARKPGWPDVEFVHAARPPDSPPSAAESSERYRAAAPDPEHPPDPPADLEPTPSTWTPNRPDDVFWLREPFVMRVTEGVSDGADVRVGPGLASYVPLQELPKHVAGAAYLSEEINFYDDGAWNLRLIEKGLQLSLRDERFVYGGSTVTQQLVKNLFLTRRKTLDRKIREAIVAWRMQGVVSKDRVLELYLNCIEFGEDLYGIGPAAERYFQKPAAELTPLEGALLAAIKPAPWFGDRFRDEGTTPTSGWWRDRIAEIMERLVQKGFITEDRAEAEKPYVLKWNDSGDYLPDAADAADEGNDGVAPSKHRGAGGAEPNPTDGQSRRPRTP